MMQSVFGYKMSTPEQAILEYMELQQRKNGDLDSELTLFGNALLSLKEKLEQHRGLIQDRLPYMEASKAASTDEQTEIYTRGCTWDPEDNLPVEGEDDLPPLICEYCFLTSK